MSDRMKDEASQALSANDELDCPGFESSKVSHDPILLLR